MAAETTKKYGNVSEGKVSQIYLMHTYERQPRVWTASSKLNLKH